MKHLLIYCFIISPLWLIAQADSIQVPTKPRGIYIGMDIFNPALAIFSDKKGIEGTVSYPILLKWNIVGEVGYEQNRHEDNIWDVSAEGFYTRLGPNWHINQDITNPNIGYYLGGRLAYSHYNQTIDKYTIQATDLPSVTGSYPEHSANAVWLEPLVGGHVNIGKSAFYIDASARLKIKLWEKNEFDIDPFIIPGFGTNNNGLNFGLNWSLGYLIPLKEE